MLITVSNSKTGIDKIRDMVLAKKKGISFLVKTINTAAKNIEGASAVKQGLERQLSEMKYMLKEAQEDHEHLERMYKTLTIQKQNRLRKKANSEFKDSFA